VLGQLAPLSSANALAIRAWNLLSNGMGGIDWSGLGFVVELLGIEDVEALTDALLAIRLHKPPTGLEPPEEEP